MHKLATKLAPCPDALETAYRAGCRYAELWLDERLLADWQSIFREVSDYPISYALHFPNQLNLVPETLEHVVALYRWLGSSSLVIHQPMYDMYREPLLMHYPTCQGLFSAHLCINLLDMTRSIGEIDDVTLAEDR